MGRLTRIATIISRCGIPAGKGIRGNPSVLRGRKGERGTEGMEKEGKWKKEKERRRERERGIEIDR